MALGLGLVSVAFFGVIDEQAAPQAVGAEFTAGFVHAMWWVVGVLLAVFALMFALPKHSAGQPAGHSAEEAAGESAVDAGDGSAAGRAAGEPVRAEPVPVL